jgi:hypothetical protein
MCKTLKDVDDKARLAVLIKQPTGIKAIWSAYAVIAKVFGVLALPFASYFFLIGLDDTKDLLGILLFSVLGFVAVAGSYYEGDRVDAREEALKKLERIKKNGKQT